MHDNANSVSSLSVLVQSKRGTLLKLFNGVLKEFLISSKYYCTHILVVFIVVGFLQNP